MVRLGVLLIAARGEPRAADLLSREKFWLFGFKIDIHQAVDIELLGALSRLERFRDYDSVTQRLIGEIDLEDVNYILEKAGCMGIYSILMV